MPKLYIYTDDPDREPLECVVGDDYFEDEIFRCAYNGYMDEKRRVWYPPHRIKRVEWEEMK